MTGGKKREGAKRREEERSSQWTWAWRPNTSRMAEKKVRSVSLFFIWSVLLNEDELTKYRINLINAGFLLSLHVRVCACVRGNSPCACCICMCLSMNGCAICIGVRRRRLDA